MGFDELYKRSAKSEDTGTKKPNDRTVISGQDFLESPPEKLSEGDYELKGENGESFYLTDAMLSMGLMLLGSTGCGKTTTLFQLMDQVIKERQLGPEDTMIIFDSKHDFRKRYYDKNNPNHLLLSLDEKDKDESVIWNIFMELFNGDGPMTANALEVNSREIASMLFEGIESKMQPMFNLSAADFLSKIICTVLFDAFGKKKGKAVYQDANNYELNRLLSECDNDKLLEITGRRNEYRYLRTYVGDGKSNQALGVYAYLSSARQRTFISRFSEQSMQRAFGIREFIRNKGGKILFLEYDHRYKETLSVIYSLFYNLAIKEALSCPGGNKWFICDEANLVPYITSLQDLLNVGRSFGCKTVFGLQSFAQLKNNYDEAYAESLAAGFCNLFAFHNTDYSSREYVKQRSGEVFEAYNYAGENVTHESFTVRDSDLQNLECGQAFVDIKHVQPFRFKFKDWK